MSSYCEHCPARGLCLARPAYCGWAAEQPPDPAKLLAIVNRSRIASGLPPDVHEPAGRPEYPSVATMAGSALKAAGRAVAAAVTGRSVFVPREVYEARLAVCLACPHYDRARTRCVLCGCRTSAKLRGARESCPDNPPRWGQWEGPNDADR